MSRNCRNRKNRRYKTNPDFTLYNTIYGNKNGEGSIINDIISVYYRNSEGSPYECDNPTEILIQIFEILECVEDNEDYIRNKLNKNTVISILKRLFKYLYGKQNINFIFLKKEKRQIVHDRRSNKIFEFIKEHIFEFINIPKGWEDVFIRKSCRIKIAEESEKLEGEHYHPLPEDVFNFAKYTKFNKIKIVIMGQDPYHDGSAMGLSFSMRRTGKSIRPSLRNIYNRMEATITRIDENGEEEHWERPDHGDLTILAKQGILFLNICLTVDPEEGAKSHSKRDIWDTFVEENIIRYIIENDSNVVFILWGRAAQKLENSIGSDNPILKCSHPSSYSYTRGFNRMNHFNEANELLIEQGKKPINYFKLK